MLRVNLGQPMPAHATCHHDKEKHRRVSTYSKKSSSRKMQRRAFLTHYRPAMPFGKRKKNILEDLFSSVLSQFKRYHPFRNLKCIHSGIFQSLKYTFMEKSFPEI